MTEKRRRKMLTVATLAAMIAGLCLSYAYFVEPNRLVVNRADIRIPAWDAAFEGLKIVAISDIHGGSNGGSEEMILRVVEKANAENADAIVILGDFVSTNSDPSEIRMPVSVIADRLSGLKAKEGVFAVLGNHDGWHGNDRIADELRRVGITVLENEIAFIERSGQKIRIFGMRDHLHMGSWATFDVDMRAAAARYEQTGEMIVLQHSPDVFPVLNAFHTFGSSFKLMLAGHTHGGQIWLPLLGSPIVPSSFGQRYNRGHVREEGVDMFVTTGVGTSILPFRFLMPPEIAVLTIRSE